MKMQNEYSVQNNYYYGYDNSYNNNYCYGGNNLAGYLAFGNECIQLFGNLSGQFQRFEGLAVLVNARHEIA